MKRLLVILTLLLPLIAACGSSDATAPGNEYGSTVSETSPVPASESTQAPAPAATLPPAASTGGDLQVDRSQLSDELFLFNWTDYIDPSVLEDFEKEYGVRVTVDLYDANEKMIPKISTGNSGYDIVVPSDYAVQMMIQDNLLAPLDKNLLPNLKHIDPAHLNLYFDPGNSYSVPYFWGTTGIAYDKTNPLFATTPPDSWADLFDPQILQTYPPSPADRLPKQVSMLEDPRETPGAALVYLGKSINSTDPADLQAAEELLTTQKPYLAVYDSANVNLNLANGDIVIAQAWSGMAAQAIAGIGDKPGNPNIAFVIPKEGGTIWQDNMAIVADSPNKYTAHVFINFMMRPDIAARNANYVLYLTPNRDARSLLDQKTKDIYAAGIEPDAETMKRLQWIERNEQTTTAFADLWTRLTGQ